MKAELGRLEEELAARRPRAATSCSRSVPNPPDPIGARRLHGRGRGRAPPGRRAAAVRLRAARPPRARAGSTWSAARASPARASPTASGDAALARARALPLRARPRRRERLRARPPAGARPRGGDVRHRLPPDRRGQHLLASSATSSTSPGTSEVALAALPHGRDRSRRRSCRSATRATRRASAARRARPARTRAACSACTSSTRSRCSSSACPSASGDEHELLLAIEEELVGELGLPYRVVNVAAGDLGALRDEEVRHRGVVPVPGALPRDHVDLEHDRLPGAPARRPLPRRARRRAAAHAERHGGHRPHCSRCWRTSRTRAAVSVPEVLGPYGAPARIEPRGLGR